VNGLVTRATAGVADMECAQVQAVHCVVDEVGQVALGQPLLQRTGHEVLLVGLVRNVAGAHPSNLRILTHSASGVTLLLPPSLLGWRSSTFKVRFAPRLTDMPTNSCLRGQMRRYLQPMDETEHGLTPQIRVSKESRKLNELNYLPALPSRQRWV
jgi:hypothetical protein